MSLCCCCGFLTVLCKTWFRPVGDQQRRRGQQESLLMFPRGLLW